MGLFLTVCSILYIAALLGVKDALERGEAYAHSVVAPQYDFVVDIGFEAAFLLLLSGVPFGALVYLWLSLRVYRVLPQLFSRRRRRLIRWRKQLAALLSCSGALRKHESWPHHAHAKPWAWHPRPGGLAILLEDDERMSVQLQSFLAEHQVHYSLPLYDADGRFLFAVPDKVDVLAEALTKAVGKGSDNELFVLLVDLLELDDRLTPLLQAVRLALSRHHQVVVVCPWPPDVPPPTSRLHTPDRRLKIKDGNPVLAGAVPSAMGNPQSAIGSRRDDWLNEALTKATAARLHRAYRKIRQEFARLRVPVVNARSDDPVALILDRMDTLRTGGLRR